MNLCEIAYREKKRRARFEEGKQSEGLLGVAVETTFNCNIIDGGGKEGG